MQVIHYHYKVPYFNGSCYISEEYELYDNGEFKGIFYENPALSAPIIEKFL